MRSAALGVLALTAATWLALAGCGESSSDGGAPGAAGQEGGDAGSNASAGTPSGGGSSAGTSSSAGKPSGGSGSMQGGTGTGGTDSGDGGASEPGGDAGRPSSSGGAGGLVECDPKQALCKLLPGDCPPMQVREVVGTCWGECVKIDRCACNSADDCPNNNEFTCWMGTHCGPYVK